MRREIGLEWEILEAEEEEWAEVTMAPAPAARKSARPQGVTALLGVVVLLVAVAGVSGYRLWREAEAGIVATERHIGTLVEVETLRQQAGEPGTVLETGVQSVVVKGSAAMVRVVVAEMSPAGHELSRVETRFYRRCPAGWQRTGPVLAFWGDKAVLDTTTLHYEFYELDRPFVEQVAEPMDTFHQALRELLGLPPLGSGERITVEVLPTNAGLGIIAPSGNILLSSPELLYVGDDAEKDLLIAGRLQTLLRTRALHEICTRHAIGPEWQAMLSYLEAWIDALADDLPAIVQGNQAIIDQHPFTYPISLFTGIVTDDIGDHFPGYQEYRSQSIEFAALTFLDFLVVDRGPGAISALLAAFGTQDSWPGVMEAAFGLSMDELQLVWDAYVQREPGPTIQDGSTVRAAFVR